MHNNENNLRPKLCIVVSVPMMARFFLVNHIIALNKKYDVSLITNMSTHSNLLSDVLNNVKFHHVSIHRKISVYHDFIALFELIKIFKQQKYDLIYSISPKAGILSMFGSWVLGTPTRVHTFTGQVWVTSKGVKRILLKFIDKLIFYFSTYCLVDSHSQYNFLISKRVINSSKSRVLLNGSISGVDVNRFHQDRNIRDQIRSKLLLNNSEVVFLFIGRLNREKGVIDLINAFIKILPTIESATLLLVGPDEDNIKKHISILPHRYGKFIKTINYTTSPEEYMMASDILCLPSYREGFGSVIIEAAACGIPAIGSRIYGITDAINHNITGVLVNNKKELQDAMLKLAGDKNLRLLLGDNARKRALSDFSQERVIDAFVSFIDSCVTNEKI